MNADQGIKEMCSTYATDTDRWFLFAENVDDIITENSSYLCDYAQSMELATDDLGNVKEVSFPVESSYTDLGKYVQIGDWVWKRKGVDSEKFSFDSDAEREFADILKDLAKDDNAVGDRVAMQVNVGKNNPHAGELKLDGTVEPQKLNPKKKYLWGKNFLSQSEIKFEYCLGTIHSSYPDFVMKDSYGRIHLFEVKSVNGSSSNFDSDEYKDKMEELKKCYLQASLLTGYNFYLPVLEGESWHITLLSKGQESTLTLNQFKAFVKS
jgi:type III restriction enzyme